MKKIITSKGVIDLAIPASPRLDSSGEFYMVCPVCTPGRKSEHQKEKKFAINLDKHPNPWRCNHCGEGGYVLDDAYYQSMKIKPILSNVNWLAIPEQVMDFFKQRKISPETVEKFKIRCSTESMLQLKHSDPSKKGTYVSTQTIGFPYFKSNMLINVKFRDSRKNFKMIKGATKILYNIDAIRESKEAVIVEGEMDVLSYAEAGIDFCVSVPNGAQISEKEKKRFEETGQVTIDGEYNLEYLDLCIEDFNHHETIYIATDDDPAGIKLREQIARRLGKSRCKYIIFSKHTKENGDGCKDANDVLIHCGALELKNTLIKAVSYPIENVKTATSYIDSLRQDYFEGKSKGLSTGWKSLDPHFNWMRGWTYLVNGYPSQGKSSVLFNLILMNTLLYKWKCGVYLPENYPEKNVINTMVEILVGNTTDPKFGSRMEWREIEKAVKEHIDKYIFFLNHEKGFSPEDLREKKELLVKKNGIVMFVTDPWLALNHDQRKKFNSVDEYINYELNYEIRQAQHLELINIIAHHPSTPIKTKDKEYSAPSPFEPIGGQIWYNKVFSLICVHRNNTDDWKNTLTEFHVQKQKEEKLAGIRTNRDEPVLLKFDRRTNRLYEKEDVSEEHSEYTRCPFDEFKIFEDESLNIEF